MPSRARQILRPLAFLLMTGASVRAGEVELAPFLGVQYGGALATPTGGKVAIDIGLQWGATLDVGFARSWSAELLFARQETKLAGAPHLGLAVERYLAGVREEKQLGRARFHGTGFVGLTRVLPDGLGADERFTMALGLGLRWPLTRRLGVRADARGYYALVSSGGGTVCIDASCLVVFGGSGVWQGDLTAAFVWTFGAPPDLP